MELSGDIDGAELRIDGLAYEGRGARRRVRVNPGRHVVAAHTPDGRSRDETVELDRGGSRVVRSPSSNSSEAVVRMLRDAASCLASGDSESR